MANTANASPLTTNFNVPPYYDDYDETKDFYRILYKPGYAVQARELTQMQTILQKQIYRFGTHVFQEGSIVITPRIFEIQNDKNFQYVKIKDLDSANNVVDVTKFKGLELNGQVSGIKATVIDVADGTESSQNTKTLFVTYTSFNTTTPNTRTFTTNETLTSNVGTVVVLANNATGISSRFTISEGTIFSKEHFVRFDAQSIVLDRYNPSPTCRVGFRLTESIVDYTEDSSLLDPALESSNYAAPGADRFRIKATLEKLPIDNNEGTPDFVELLTIKEGAITEDYRRPQYNILRDELAKRTFDESGNYYVKGLGVRVREHLDTGVNLGLKPAAEGGKANTLAIGVEPGTGYCEGYEIIKWETTYVETPKSIDKESIQNQIVSSGFGNYVTVKEVSGVPELDIGRVVLLYDKEQKRVSAPTTVTGNVIGTAKILSAVYDNGTLGTPSGTIRLHLFDIKMNGSNSFTSTKSFYSTQTPSTFSADAVLDSANTAILEDPTGSLIYYAGAPSVNSITDLSHSYRKTSSATLGVNGLVSTPATSGSELISYGPNAVLSTNDKRGVILTFNEARDINTGLTVSTGTSGSNTITGTGYSRLNAGDKIKFPAGGPTGTYFINIVNATGTELILDKTLDRNATGNTITKTYLTGDIIDLTLKGNTGVVRTGSVSSDGKTLTLDLKETFSSAVSCSITYPITRTVAPPATKTLRDNRFVIINCATAGINGPFNLGISDVYKIRYIKQYNSLPSDENGTDVTGKFRFDNGQRDTLYDHATITPTSRFLTTSNYLLVKLDYFQPSYSVGKGYFTVDSYDVDDTTISNTTIRTENIPSYVSPVSGFSYNLRNSLDYRPVKTNTAADSQTIAGATTNPSQSDTFQSDGTSLRVPSPDDRITYDYDYYLARIDLVSIDKNGVIQVTKGVPDIYPRTPPAPDNTMPLASIGVVPYPSLSPEYAQKINKPELGCSVKKMSNLRSTMRDINVMKSRITNLEYYTSLSLLEKSALDMKVLDENGLDRFKNGIFVDSFTDHSLGDKNNLDYRIVVDKEEKCIRPAFTTHSFRYHLTANTNTIVNGELVTLPYTEKVLIDRPKASSFTNIELQVFRWIGQLYLDPPIDNWVDTRTVPPNALTMGLETNNSLNLVLPELNLQNDLGNLNLDLGVISNEINLGTIGLDTNIDLTQGSSPQNITTYYGAPKKVIVGVNYYQRVGTGWNDRGALLVSGTQDTQALYQQAVRASNGGAGRVFKDVIYATITEGTRVGSEIFTSTDTTTSGISATAFDSKSVSATTTGTAYATSSTSASSTDTASATVNLGERVVDTSIIPYIRGNKTIKLHAKGLLGNTRMFVFFDGENMSQYVTPLTFKQYNSYPWAENATTPYTASTANVAQQTIRTDATNWRSTTLPKRGDPLFTTPQGDIFAALWLPEEKKFTTGTKEVVITDSPTNSGSDATCFASSFYVAQGLTQTKQDTILTTRFTTTVDATASASARSTATVSATAQVGVATSVTGNIVSTTTITDSRTTVTPVSQSTSTTETTRLGPSCSAYSFVPEAPIGDEGLFLTSVDVYFASKDPTLGCWFEVCEMSPDGGVTRNQIPFSEVWLEPNEINISDDASVPTRVRFKAPIFLYSGIQYAFILHTVGLNPNYRVWVSKLGETDVATGTQITSRALTGTFFRTNNGKNWDIIPDLDLKCTFYRASFVTNVDGTAILGNEPVEKLLITQPSAVFTTYGEGIVGDDDLTLTNISGTISVGDYLRGNTSTANGQVLIKNGSTYSMSNTRYISGEIVTSNAGVTATVSSISYPEAILSSHSTTARVALIELNSSNGKFKNNVKIYGLSSNNTARVYANLSYRYSTVDFEPTYLRFNRTGISFEMKPTSNTGTEGSWHRIEDNIDYEYTSEQAILSRTNEIATYGTGSTKRSNEVRATMRTFSEYVSPVLDIGKTHSLYTDNLINANTYGENGTSGGSLFNKYISKIVTLAEGQDAEDLRIVLTAYRPPDTDINVWVKILNAEDGELLNKKPWVLMDKTGQTLFSSSTNKKDYKEFVFTFSQSPMNILKFSTTNTGSNGAINYLDNVRTIRSGEANITGTITLIENDTIFLDTNGFRNGENVHILFAANNAYKGNARISTVGNTSSLTGVNGEVQYSTGIGAPYVGFKYFVVKVGLSGNNSALVPKVADLRCVCLQM